MTGRGLPSGVDPEVKRQRLVIGEEIRTARTRAGLSQTRLAALVGLAQRTISGIETGDLRLPVETLIKIMRALRVSVEIRFRPVPRARKN